ncbi:MAG: hypothetical protein BGO55_03625 [Sphingobacteriales bacterium 50-39]|nr:DUF4157 domain-containing protein [Sphingobacteriales bacterium]OJW55639.1 MAG: hypothetical protein BGO55_03625 [Sphingobacteriales bacterium 50-39]
MSYRARVYRKRNPSSPEETKEKPFFSSRREHRLPGTRGGFFQAKLEVNAPGDKHEQEADAVARSVVNEPDKEKNKVQRREITAIQRLATPEEDEKLGTNDARMRRDRDIQKKPESTGTSASPAASSKIEGSSGKGKPLPAKTLREMNSSFGVDFSTVHIHDNNESADLNKELHAQAFTHGEDIYFNEGKFDPDSHAGKFLLAHELTHVIQQSDKPKLQRDADPSTDQANDAVLRQMAQRPVLALRKWQTLGQSDQDKIKYNMILMYGPPYTSEFLLYAQGTKTPKLGPPGVLKGFGFTPKYMYEHGFRNAYGDLWVHPSGEEITLLPPNQQPQQDCTNNCLTDSDDEDGCRACCADKFPEEGSDCRKTCDASCNDKL